MPEKKFYRVEWAIDFEAETPEEAAAMALTVMRDNDPANSAVCFTCIEENGDQHRVDLLEDE